MRSMSEMSMFSRDEPKQTTSGPSDGSGAYSSSCGSRRSMTERTPYSYRKRKSSSVARLSESERTKRRNCVLPPGTGYPPSSRALGTPASGRRVQIACGSYMTKPFSRLRSTLSESARDDAEEPCAERAKRGCAHRPQTHLRRLANVSQTSRKRNTVCTLRHRVPAKTCATL